MFVCGREEPIQVNEMLYAYNERPVGVGSELSCFVDPRLNRYSFVWFSDEEDGNADAFSRLLSAILTQWGADLTWVQQRPYFPPGKGAARIAAFWQRQRLRDLQRLHRPDGSIDFMARYSLEHNADADADIEVTGRQAEEASQLALKQFGDEGWATFHDDSMIVATKAAKVKATFALPYFGRGHWRFLVFGSAPAPETFARPPLRASVETRDLDLRPSRQFLAWLADHPYTIGYRATDESNRLGLVVVGTQKVDVDRLIVQGVVKGIEAMPEYVWSYSPVFYPGRAD